MKRVAFLAALALVTLASTSRADDKTIVLHTQVIHGRVARPLVVTEVTRLPVASTLSVLQKPLVGRIDGTVARAPF